MSSLVFRADTALDLQNHPRAVQFERIAATRRIGIRCTTVIGFLVFVMFSFAYPSAGFAEDPLVKPESVGFSSERLQRFSAVYQQEIERGSFPGAVVLIARDGKIVLAGSTQSADGAPGFSGRLWLKV